MENRIELRKKNFRGVRLAIKKLIAERAKENGYLIVSKNGKVIKVSAKSLLKKSKNNSK